MTDLVERLRARAAPQAGGITDMAEELCSMAADRIEWANQLDVTRAAEIEKLRLEVEALKGEKAELSRKYGIAWVLGERYEKALRQASKNCWHRADDTHLHSCCIAKRALVDS